MDETPIQPDDFEAAGVIPGLEHLGRAIVDAAGVPSGSPANFEALRGAQGAGAQEAPDIEAQVRAILEQFPAEG